jgi:hypothetical protein
MEQAEHGLNDKEIALGRFIDMRLMNVGSFVIQHSRHTDFIDIGKNIYLLRGYVPKRPTICFLQFPYNPFFRYGDFPAILHAWSQYGNVSYEEAYELVDRYFLRLP